MRIEEERQHCHNKEKNKQHELQQRRHARKIATAAPKITTATATTATTVTTQTATTATATTATATATTATTATAATTTTTSTTTTTTTITTTTAIEPPSVSEFSLIWLSPSPCQRLLFSSSPPFLFLFTFCLCLFFLPLGTLEVY